MYAGFLWGHRSSSDLAVHGARVVLAHGLRHGEHLDRDRPRAEGDGHMVAHLDVIAGLGRLAVDGDARIVARLIGDRAALDEAGNLQIFIKSHEKFKPFRRVPGTAIIPRKVRICQLSRKKGFHLMHAVLK